MDIQVSAIKLYELIRAKSDQKTAEDVVAALQDSIKEEVKEATNQIKDLKIDLIDRINSAKIQTILWVVGIGVLQLVAKYFLK